jgi:pSer/pThr/pTyr-binding forkhead associated (FHA) protein
VELRDRLAAERRLSPFLVGRDTQGRQFLVTLDEHDERLTIGRMPDCDIALPWDPRVSRVQAVLERMSGAWVIADDGLSLNGTYVDGERVVDRRRLRDGDGIRLGGTALTFRDPSAASFEATAIDEELPALLDVTPTQRKVLIALCRPLARDHHARVPATNQAIAAELVVSVEAVKGHLRRISARFGVEDLPQNAKRQRTAEIAMRVGLVTEKDLQG